MTQHYAMLHALPPISRVTRVEQITLTVLNPCGPAEVTGNAGGALCRPCRATSRPRRNWANGLAAQVCRKCQARAQNVADDPNGVKGFTRPGGSGCDEISEERDGFHWHYGPRPVDELVFAHSKLRPSRDSDCLVCHQMFNGNPINPICIYLKQTT